MSSALALANFDKELYVKSQELHVKKHELLGNTKNFLAYTKKKGLNFLVQPVRRENVKTSYLTSCQ